MTSSVQINYQHSEPICIPNLNVNCANKYTMYAPEYQYENENEYATKCESPNRTISFFNKEYGLKENKFDPLKFSPPKNFMIKLHMRMSNYASTSLGINDINRNSE